MKLNTVCNKNSSKLFMSYRKMQVVAKELTWDLQETSPKRESCKMKFQVSEGATCRIVG